jgi:hypothetical protein
MYLMSQETSPLSFKEFIFQEFIDWEKKQPGKRSSVSAFARWLTDNPYQIEFKQQLISDWIKGKYSPREEMYILVLSEKLGKIVYKLLNVKPIDPLRIYVLRNWEKAPQTIKVQVAKTIAKHTTEPLPDEARENTSPKSKGMG